MSNSNALRPLARANAVVAALVLAGASLLPALLVEPASADTLVHRFIDMSSFSSAGGNSAAGSGRTSATGVTYTIGFDVPATGNIGAIAVEFCGDADGNLGTTGDQTGPILLDACNTPSGFDIDTSTTDPTNQVGIGGFTKNALSDANLYVISDGTPDSVTSNLTDADTDNDFKDDADVKFDVTGVVNPDYTGTFYARITTYAAEADLPTTTWVSTAEGTADNSIGTIVDDGGIALSTANELTVTARVQEVLEFCVGTETASSITPATGDDCANNIAGTDLDLGVVDSNSIATTTGTDNGDGLMMIRTNGLYGATIYYKAEQDTSSGKLKQAGAACSGVSTADPCFNSVAAGAGTRAAVTAGSQEAFGVALKERITTTGGATNALQCDADYYGDGTAACTGAVAGNNYAWLDTGQFDTLAASTGPIDDETVQLEFAAQAAPTTPTGLYTVTANFVATATY